jgi:hypothetical protein
MGEWSRRLGLARVVLMGLMAVGFVAYEWVQHSGR